MTKIRPCYGVGAFSIIFSRGKIRFEIADAHEIANTQPYLIEYRDNTYDMYNAPIFQQIGRHFGVRQGKFLYRISAMRSDREHILRHYEYCGRVAIGETRFGHSCRHYDTIYCRYCTKIFLLYIHGHDRKEVYRKLNIHIKKCARRHAVAMSIENIIYAVAIYLHNGTSPYAYLPR